MIKNIVFDMGQVMIRFERKTFIERVGITDPSDQKLLRNKLYVTYEWAAMDRGTLNEESAEERILPRLPERLHEAARLLLSKWDRPILPVEGMAELVKELKENGYGIYLLSNASVRQHEYWPRVPGAEYFDGTLISADVKLVKPQPEIYRVFYEKFHLDPAECIFIDDNHNNIEGAVYTGMQGIVFHNDMAELREELRAAGVNCQKSEG